MPGGTNSAPLAFSVQEGQYHTNCHGRTVHNDLNLVELDVREAIADGKGHTLHWHVDQLHIHVNGYTKSNQDNADGHHEQLTKVGRNHKTMHHALCEICEVTENGGKYQLGQIDPLIFLTLNDDLHNHVSYEHADNTAAKILMYNQGNHVRQ